MTTTATWTGLRLNPLDVLFFRDGRPFDATNRVQSGLPNPQTLAGALRTALLAQAGFGRREFEAFAARRRAGEPADAALRQLQAPEWVIRSRFRGPWVAFDRGNGICEPLLPVPQTLARQGPFGEGKWVQADPIRDLPGWPKDTGLLPVWRKGSPDAKHPGGFLTAGGVREYLVGGKPDDTHWFQDEELYDYENRIGIEVNPGSFTAAEGMLYGIRLLRLRERAGKSGFEHLRLCLFAECDTGGEVVDLSSVPLPFGGEGKHARLDTAKAMNWASLSPVSVGSACLRLLATPGVVGDGLSHPGRLAELDLRAAASGQPIGVSGWDVARSRPLPTRFAVPAGSVYFTRSTNNPADDSLCTDAEDVAQGWGFALKGAWTDVD